MTIVTVNINIKMKEIYLDNSATTRVYSNVVSKMKEVFEENYGNPSSMHEMGSNAFEVVENARGKIAKFVGAKPGEIIFTSGGTESNNLAIFGIARANPSKKHIITSVIEHPSVLEVVRALEREGYKIDYVSVNSEGLVNVKEIKEKIKEDTLLVSVMHVNNEIGTIQPVEEIGSVCRGKGVYFHTDAVQSFKKIDIDVEKMNIDLMSVSGHKIGGPKGVGLLYIREGVRISPLFHGGGQERGIRSGTLNVSGIVGLAESLNFIVDRERLKRIRDKMIEEFEKIPNVRINGSKEKRIYNNINISFYGIEGEGLMLKLNDAGIYVSTGSACASTKLEESYVLKAIGVDELYVHGSIRITLGDIKEEDISYVVSKITESVRELRKMSPFKINLEGENGKNN